MSRGPTRRVRRLLTAGEVSPGLLRTADHEAELLAHPYIGIEHLQLAQTQAELVEHGRTAAWRPRRTTAGRAAEQV